MQRLTVHILGCVEHSQGDHFGAVELAIGTPSRGQKVLFIRDDVRNLAIVGENGDRCAAQNPEVSAEIAGRVREWLCSLY